MTVIENTGTFTTTGTPTSIFGGTITDGLSAYSGWLFLNAIPTNTEVEITIIVYDAQDSTLRPYQTRFRSTAQVANETAFFFPPILTQQYDVQISTTKGSNFEVSWARYRQVV